MWQRDDKIENLISCMLEYKAEMDFNAKDFNADKVKFYESARQRLAAIYKEDLSFFGPEKTASYPFPGRNDSLLSVEEQVVKEKWEKQIKLDQELIKRGYNRVLEKIKDISQNFANAITTGRRSGSRKIVMEFYEELVKLWGGSPTTKSLTFGVSLNSISNNIPSTSGSNTSPVDVNSCTSSTSCSLKSSPSPASENEVQHGSSSGHIPTNSDAEDEFLADNLSDLSDPLLTSTVKREKCKRNFHETSAVQVALYPD